MEKKIAQAPDPKMEGKEREEAYNAYVKQLTPQNNLCLQMIKAFVTGGIFCVIGQMILNVCQSYGLDKETSGAWCSLLLILLSVILTGLSIYQVIAAWGGAGALVPITGFANSVVSPALEFRREGLVMGVGAKLFTLAGPVLVYGICSSIIVGLIAFLMEVI